MNHIARSQSLTPAQQTRDKLSLLTSGTGGVDELVKALPDDDVSFAFCREEEKDRSYFVRKYPALFSARAHRRARSV